MVLREIIKGIRNAYAPILFAGGIIIGTQGMDIASNSWEIADKVVGAEPSCGEVHACGPRRVEKYYANGGTEAQYRLLLGILYMTLLPGMALCNESRETSRLYLNSASDPEEG